MVSGVSVSSFAKSDGASYFRLRVTLDKPAVHQLRVSGTRLYVDLAPPGTTARPSVSAEAVIRPSDEPQPTPAKPVQSEPAPAPASSPPAPAAVGPALPARETSVLSAKPASSYSDPTEAYRDLRASAVQKARELAAQPDVRGLLRLQEEVKKRDVELGKRQPDFMTRLLDELTKYTDEARALQLERDRSSFGR
jgi:type IV secretory pathway VirB10-like protein